MKDEPNTFHGYPLCRQAAAPSTAGRQRQCISLAPRAPTKSLARRKGQDGGESVHPRSRKTRRYSSGLQKLSFLSPNAWREAEDTERTRLVEHLAHLLRGSPAPMGVLLQEKPRNWSLLGGCRRGSTLRTRSRVGLELQPLYPSRQEHYTDHLQVRLSEPCSRVATKNVHLSHSSSLAKFQGLRLLREYPRLSFTPWCTKRCSANSSLPPLQAGASHVHIHAARTAGLQHERVHGDCWYSWCTLRFSHHRGLRPCKCDRTVSHTDTLENSQGILMAFGAEHFLLCIREQMPSARQRL